MVILHRSDGSLLPPFSRVAILSLSHMQEAFAFLYSSEGRLELGEGHANVEVEERQLSITSGNANLSNGQITKW